MIYLQTEAEEYKLVYAINELISQLRGNNRRDLKDTTMRKPASLIKEVMVRINKVEILKDQPNFVHHAGQLMNYLKSIPMNEYLPFIMKENVEEDYQEEVALDYENRLTEIFCSLMKEETAGESSQKNIMKIRQMIKDEGLGEEIYAACRLFLRAEHVLDTRKNLKSKMLKEGIPVTIMNIMLHSFYVNVGQLSGKKRLCPCCGGEWSRSHLEQSPVCQYYYQTKECWYEPIEKNFNGEEVVLRLDDEIIESIVLPNLGEVRLRDRVLLLGKVKVVMYPGCDDYDLKIITEKATYLIDLKDFYKASGLIQHIKNDAYGLAKLTKPNNYQVPIDQVFLVIPQHRLAISEADYLGKVKDGLASKNVRVLSEEELVQHIKKTIKE